MRDICSMLEVDELDTVNTTPKHKGNKVVGGIEYNPWNRPVGYFFRQYSIDGMENVEPVYLEAKDVIFYFTKKRPSQIRELSDAAPTITRIRDANEFMTAVGIKERILSCLSVFIKRDKPPSGFGNTRQGTSGPKDKSTDYGGKTVSPGMIMNMNPGDTDCEQVKSDAGYDEEHSVVLWPQVLVNGKKCAYSAVYGAMASYNTALNEDVPYLYPSNKELNVDGAVLADGTEVFLDQVQAGDLNGAGIVTAFHDTVWKAYGNNTGCYPANTDPKDRWIGCRRMFDYVANYFVTVYRNRLDSNMNRRTVDDIVNSFNIWGNSLVASGMCAGLYAEYRQEENTTEDILNGHLKLHIFFAPYTPVEYINAEMEFDVSTLENVMEQEG